MLVIERPWASLELTCGVWKVCGICVLFVMQLFFLLLVLLLYLLPLPSPSPHNNNKKEEKRKEYEKANQRTSHSGVCGTAYCSCGELSPVDMHQFFFFFLPITVALCDLAFVFFFFSALLLFKPFQSNDLKDVFSLAFSFFFFFFVCMCHFTRSFPHTSRFYLRHGIFCFSFFFFLHYHRKKLAIARLPSFSSPDFIIYCHYTGIAFCSGLTTLL